MAGSSLPDVSHDAFYATVYAELKRIARHYLRTRAREATICTTDLVHDAYFKLASPATADGRWQNRAHFFASAAQAMREVLVDHARRRSAAKRGGDAAVTTLSTGDGALKVELEDLLVLDDALTRLRALNERLHRVVELRFFAGLNEEEIAEVLDVSARTVERDWTKARLYLSRELRH
jgi:RNA polymerase sigma factor (TIGR02999 family)